MSSITILRCPDHLHLAVSPLELIKEGAHFELVDGASLQLTDHHPVVPRGVYLHDAPLPLRLPVIGRWPVKHLVPLNVRRLLLHLVDEMNATTTSKDVCVFTIPSRTLFISAIVNFQEGQSIQTKKGKHYFSASQKTFFPICEFLTVNHNIVGLLIVSPQHSCG